MPKKLNSPVNRNNALIKSKKNPTIVKQKTITAKINIILKIISAIFYYFG